MTDADKWPKLAPKLELDDLVQVLMTESQALLFESRVLVPLTANSRLSPAVFFGPDDLPTHIIS